MSRVCVVSSLYHPSMGGLGRQAQLLSERLRAAGVDLFVIARHMDGMPEAGFSPEVEVLRVRTLWPRVDILEEVSLRNVLISLSFSLAGLALLARRRGRYDVVHFHGASIPLFLCLPVLKLMGKKVVAKVAAAELGTEAGSLRGRYFGLGSVLAWLVRRTDAFVAISEEIRQGLLRDGVPAERIHRFPNFVDLDLFRPPQPGEKKTLKERLGYGGKTLVLFSGRMVSRKGVDLLLEAWKEVPPRFPGARLLLLGEGPNREQLEAKALDLGIADTSCFRGRVDNVPEHLRAADLFVLPSLQEGLPNSLLEAMGSGAACIATEIGGVTDIVRDGQEGVLVPPGRPAALAGAMCNVLGDGSLRSRLGIQAARAARNFGLDARVRDYLALYGRLSAPSEERQPT